MAQHRAQQVDLGIKLRLRMAALDALPEARPDVCRFLSRRADRSLHSADARFISQDLRAAASQPDYTLFPPHRTIPMETAPVPGYFESLRAAAEEVVSSSALGGGKRR